MNVRIIFRFSVIFSVVAFSHSVCWAQITLPRVFGNNMVLQRGIQIPVWGNATPGALVTAELGTKSATAKADQNGKWMVRFPEFDAGGPYTLKIGESGKPTSTTELNGILIGDVWLASGQSNMELQVQQANDAKNEIAKANFPEIRFLLVGHDKTLTPRDDIREGTWEVCDSVSVKQLSAVASYFSREIQHDRNVPVGIIQSTWGGTPVEAWTSREMLLSSPLTRQRVLANDTLSPSHFVQDSLNLECFWDIVYHPQNKTDITVPLPDFDDSGWTPVEMPKLIKDFGTGPYEGMMWMRKKVKVPDSFVGKELSLHVGHVEMNYSIYFNGAEICKTVWNADPSYSYTIPDTLVTSSDNIISLRIAMLWGGGGLNPPADSLYLTDGVSKIPLAGTWRYKKDLEPTIPLIRNYHYFPEVLFNAMINPLIPYGIKGIIWYQGEANDSLAYDYRTMFPMLIIDWRQRWRMGNLPFLFVQLPNYKRIQPLPSESEWAELREAQALALSLPNTGMACIIDSGEAETIHPTNKQVVGHRLALVANKLVYGQDCIASGPMYKSYKREGNRIRIRFTGIGTGLTTTDGKEVTGFEIAGNDKQFYWATAVIEGDEVVVYSDKVAEPTAVRYAWADNPVCNLVNSAALPAVPFRTDSWKGLTQK
jgi:sialate O-acetylesterase